MPVVLATEDRRCRVALTEQGEPCAAAAPYVVHVERLGAELGACARHFFALFERQLVDREGRWR